MPSNSSAEPNLPVVLTGQVRWLAQDAARPPLTRLSWETSSLGELKSAPVPLPPNWSMAPLSAEPPARAWPMRPPVS
jgi:hypothetical protein